MYDTTHSYFIPRSFTEAPQDESDLEHLDSLMISDKPTCLAYKGSASMMIDIGYLMKMFIEEDNILEGLKGKCTAVLDNLKAVMVSNWRRNPDDNSKYYVNNEIYTNKGLYPTLTSSEYQDINLCYGLTISGAHISNFIKADSNDPSTTINQNAIDSIEDSFNRIGYYSTWSEFGQFTDWWRLISQKND